MARILVTGGTGFLGLHVLAAARAAGHDVTLLSRDPAAALTRLSGVPILEGRIHEDVDLTDVITACAPDAVIHAAAVVDNHDPALIQVNVGGTARLIAALTARPRPARLVYVSSFAVEDPPPTAYSESKQGAEALVQLSKLPWVIVRPSLIYGPGDTSNGPRLVASLAAGPMLLPGGGATRIQPVHVADVAAALVEACTRDQALGRTYRLGGADAISVRDYRKRVRDLSGGSARFVSLPLPLVSLVARAASLLGRPGAAGVVSFHRHGHEVDSSDATRDLGFSPRTIEAGLTETYA